MIKAVLFDMDGVLVDTEWFYNRRRVAFMEEKGFHFAEIPDLSGPHAGHLEGAGARRC